MIAYCVPVECNETGDVVSCYLFASSAVAAKLAVLEFVDLRTHTIGEVAVSIVCFSC